MEKTTIDVDNYIKELKKGETTLGKIGDELGRDSCNYELVIQNLKKNITNITKKVITLKDISDKTGLNNNEILWICKELKNDLINISCVPYDNDIMLQNLGEVIPSPYEVTEFATDENNEMKFMFISDSRFGSVMEQPTILNNIYDQAYKNGCKNVILCGNITEGLYSKNKVDLGQHVFLNDSIMQINHVIKDFPKRDGITTYFITGKKDESHAIKNKINVGRRISKERDDMIYIGDYSANIKIDNSNMLIMSAKLAKTYTASYRAKQQIDSFRSEDKPDILVMGGLMQSDKQTYRDVTSISVPSLVATTKEMKEKRYDNTIGALYVNVKTNKKGKIENVRCTNSVYYNTPKDDYTSAKATQTSIIPTTSENNKENIKFVNKTYNQIKNGMTLEETKDKIGCSFEELGGIIELCNLYGKNLKLKLNANHEMLIYKENIKQNKQTFMKKDMSDLNYSEIAVVSDTHLGNNGQQIHLLNKVYQEAYNRGITDVLHVGDMTDGDYSDFRKEQKRQVFLHGFDEEVGYTADMYPVVDGITTYFILGSHDETHFKNGGATVEYWLPRVRPDMHFLGQDIGLINLNGTRFMLDHPGGGSSQCVSYKLQKRIETLESGHKAQIYLVGHYHKSYYLVYRNVYGLEVPALCSKTPFQEKQGLTNVVGAYFLHIWTNDKNEIVYFEPEEILFKDKDIWDEVGKDKNKVKKLIITQ